MQLTTVAAHLLDVLPFGRASGPSVAIGALAPFLVLSVFYGGIVLIVALKRRINPWAWTILALVPFINWLVVPIFLFVTLLSMLDRLHSLETAAARPAAAAGPATAEWTA
jgi:hypothetical protein